MQHSGDLRALIRPGHLHTSQSRCHEETQHVITWGEHSGPHPRGHWVLAWVITITIVTFVTMSHLS